MTKPYCSFIFQIYHQFIQNVIQNLHNQFPDSSLMTSFCVFDPKLINNDDPSHSGSKTQGKCYIVNSYTCSWDVIAQLFNKSKTIFTEKNVLGEQHERNPLMLKSLLKKTMKNQMNCSLSFLIWFFTVFMCILSAIQCIQNLLILVNIYKWHKIYVPPYNDD